MDYKIIFTGYSGFIGSYLNNELIMREGLKLEYWGRKPPSYNNSLYKFLDLANFNQDFYIERVNGNSLLFYFAAQLPGKPNDSYSKIIKGQELFLYKCYNAGITDIVYASTGGIYGFGKDINENATVYYKDTYSKYKYSGEKLINSLWPKNSLILRYFFPYGEGQNMPRLIPGLIHKIINKEEISIEGSDGITINPVYIKDAVEATLFLVNKRANGVFNIAGREEISLRRLIELISFKLSIKPKIINNLAKEKYLTGSIKRLLSLNSNLCSTDLDFGITKTINCFNG